MPVNSKKQSQGQTGKKGDDAKTKAGKTPGKATTFGSNTKGGGKAISSKGK